MLAYRDLSEEQWEEWAERYRGAEKATDFREDRLADAYEEIEQDMMVLCPNERVLFDPVCVLAKQDFSKLSV